MREIYLKWYKQVIDELEILKQVEIPKPPRKPRSIVISGMGGSGIVGDYVQTLANRRLNVPVFVVKDYKLPAWVSGEDLAVFISYSGNTFETLSCYREAVARKVNMVAISSGGKLRKYAEENKTPYIPVKKGLVPRASLPAMVFAALGTLEKVGLKITFEKEVEETVFVLKEGVGEEEINNIVYSMENTLPIIVAYVDYAPLAWRFKNELNENSKIPVKVEIVPEWGHNDIVGWEKPYSKNHTAIILQPEKKTEEPYSIMLQYTIEYMGKQGIRTYKVKCKGENLLTQLLYGSLVAGLTSVKLAERRNLDPLATRSIKEYKKTITKHFTV